ncbi:MAG TPA: PDZ domain-containing protein, partial [Terriglobales bacterium]|nr:PDZ domain-containing protein [Terriglobales bacterium]
MNRDFQIRSTAGFLVLLTAAAIILAWINFRKESQYVPPYDGVWWVERGGSIVAERVDPNGPGARAGIRAGDRLLTVDGHEVATTAAVNRQLYRDGVWSKANYSILRGSVQWDAAPILSPAQRNSNGWLRFIALIYLGIGLYVLFRRWTAPGSTHFYIFCVVSFVFYAFKYTGKLNAFDWTIYWGNAAAWVLQPALFLHFALTFPEEHRMVRARRWMVPAIYVPGLLILGFHVLSKVMSRASEMLRWQIDRMEMAYLVVYFTAAALVFLHSYREAHRPILRQQLKWVTRGTVLAIAPFAIFYAVPFLLGRSGVKVAVLSLGILPLTFGYAIVRYRLMDVDLIFKRGMAYTLAAATIAGAYFTVVALVGEFVHARVPGAGTSGLVIAIVVTAVLFDPMRKWIQGRIDRLFYGRRHDYRHT